MVDAVFIHYLESENQDQKKGLETTFMAVFQTINPDFKYPTRTLCLSDCFCLAVGLNFIA